MELAMNLNKLILDFKHVKFKPVSYDLYIDYTQGKLSKDIA